MVDLSLESILRQDGNFFKELTAAVTRLKEGKDFTTKGIKKSLIMSVIKEYTGMKVSFQIGDGWSAHMFSPMVTNNHAMFLEGNPATINKANTIFDIKANEVIGTVDTSTGKVGGIFKEMTIDLVIGVKWFDAKESSVTAAELTTIILHELGHAFTYFQFMSTLCFGNLIVSLAARDLLNAKSYGERKVILKKADEMLGTDTLFSSSEFIENPKPGVDLLMMTRYVNDLNVAALDSPYSFRNCEQLADTYVIKQCGAATYAKAMDKLFKHYKDYGAPNFFSHIFSETLYLFKFWFNHPAPLYYIFESISPEIYDRPADRIAFMKKQLIDDLKKVPKNDDKARSVILEEIKVVEEVLSTITYRRDVITYLRDTFSGVGRYIKQNVKESKELENMIYNDLFIKAAQLKNRT